MENKELKPEIKRGRGRLPLSDEERKKDALNLLKDIEKRIGRKSYNTQNGIDRKEKKYISLCA